MDKSGLNYTDDVPIPGCVFLSQVKRRVKRVRKCGRGKNQANGQANGTFESRARNGLVGDARGSWINLWKACETPV